HQLVFTVLAGERSDLLDASLAVTATSAASGHDHYPVAWLVVAGAVSLALTGWLVVRRRRGGMSR
ncbi:LPXTG cell wall anchor domain-containing protein, partial [Acinetobacter baumannii]